MKNELRCSAILEISLDCMAERDQEALTGAQAVGLCNTDFMRIRTFAHAAGGNPHALGVLLRAAEGEIAVVDPLSEDKGQFLQGLA